MIGAGGHGKVIADLVCRCGDKIFGFLDDNEKADTFGYLYLGTVSAYTTYIGQASFIIAIGDNRTREAIVQKLSMQTKLKWKTYIHPSAQIGNEVYIGKGSVVLANSTINAYTHIGEHCIINTGAIIEHDNQIGDYVHVAPRAVLGGNVRIGKNTQVGIGAIVRNNLQIAENSLLGAGTVAVRDIRESGVYIGIPAQRKKEKYV